MALKKVRAVQKNRRALSVVLGCSLAPAQLRFTVQAIKAKRPLKVEDSSSKIWVAKNPKQVKREGQRIMDDGLHVDAALAHGLWVSFDCPAYKQYGKRYDSTGYLSACEHPFKRRSGRALRRLLPVDGETHIRRESTGVPKNASTEGKGLSSGDRYHCAAEVELKTSVNEHRRGAVTDLLGTLLCMSKGYLRGPHPPCGLYRVPYWVNIDGNSDIYPRPLLAAESAHCKDPMWQFAGYYLSVVCFTPRNMAVARRRTCLPLVQFASGLVPNSFDLIIFRLPEGHSILAVMSQGHPRQIKLCTKSFEGQTDNKFIVIAQWRRCPPATVHLPSKTFEIIYMVYYPASCSTSARKHTPVDACSAPVLAVIKLPDAGVQQILLEGVPFAPRICRVIYTVYSSL
ncbi:hypothetical protein B0H13DRAFT_1921969 [Mycena leptocephala]|nr:hypothetical protein B0H13DRAFT_1921969 [Mycena leptocephala]